MRSQQLRLLTFEIAGIEVAIIAITEIEVVKLDVAEIEVAIIVKTPPLSANCIAGCSLFTPGRK